MMKMVIPVRLERTTLSLEGRCSIQLSYGTTVSLEVRFLYRGFTPCFQALLWAFGLWGILSPHPTRPDKGFALISNFIEISIA